MEVHSVVGRDHLAEVGLSGTADRFQLRSRQPTRHSAANFGCEMLELFTF